MVTSGSHMMREIRYASLCLVVAGVSCGLYWLVGGASFALKVYHRWYGGIAAIFFVSFVFACVVFIRGRFATRAWPIAIATLAAWACAGVADIIYFGLFETTRFVSTMRQSGIVSFLFAGFVMPPVLTLSWLVGVMAGGLLMLARLPLRRAPSPERKMGQ
jgi:hypothetical protein